MRLNIIGFLKFIIKNRNLVTELTRKEFISKYLGSYLGIIWALIQPLVTIIIFWFLFAVGFRTKPAGMNFPYILWLLSGIIPWFFINDSITNGAVSILDNSYLIKKMAFRASILPLVRVLSALMVHSVFLFVLLLFFIIYGYPLTVYSLQILYYLASSIILVSGISLITATITVFIKDMRHFISIFMQFCFWLSAIFWPLKILPAQLRIFIKLNPFYYIIEGFRNSLIHHKWFWSGNLRLTIYFWCLTGIIFLTGLFLFKKFRPYFADYI